ncbi:carbohydrate-binding protein [Winogradskyella aurantiaca]|uniref:carbohydrate-binding protein n=1 Tax=Winogradskyella aurantiaca TaxID=2219558 RepID=UPI0018E515E7|nr:carbohydrate-binding protein [Winogradskyella aurantiaca]
MKEIVKISGLKVGFLAMALLMLLSCEREISDQAVPASFSREGRVFIDNFVGMGEDFYLPFADSYFEAFSRDQSEGFESSASYRVDVPNPDNASGTYAGAILRIDGAGRDLSGFDALTFYARASRGVIFDEVGFGQDFNSNTYQVNAGPLSVSTQWTKYTIPLPDASKLTQERGMFWYSGGTRDNGGAGYTIWFDDIQFEKLGTIAQPRPKIFRGQDLIEQTFIGSSRQVDGLEETFNLANGQDITVFPFPAYYEFSSSNTSVANVDSNGTISISGTGTTVITATINGLEAEGSLTLESLGEFVHAPAPDRNPDNVISVFSDAYTNVPVDYYNGFFAPFQTTQGGAPPLTINGEQVINYTELNFVGIGTFLNVAPINTNQMTHVHVDINVQEEIEPSDFIRLQILNDVGTDDELSGDYTITASELATNEWKGFDIPLGNFSGLTERDAVGLFFFISDATITNIYTDNIYYYQEVLDPTPNVDDSAATQAELPLGFESTNVTYNFVAFEGAESAIEANPDQSGLNPTATIMRTTKTNGAQFFAGTFLDLDAPIDFSSSQKLRVKVWSPKANIPVRFALETAGGGNQVFVDANVPVANEWVELEFDFGPVYNPELDYQRFITFFEFIDGVAGDGSTYYFDDIQVLND